MSAVPALNNMEIIPAIMPRNFNDLEEKAFLVKGLVTFVQIDIMDGKLTKNSTWPYKNNSREADDEIFDLILKEERGLPCWEDLEYEIDLMVVDPENAVGEWLVAGASRIVIHVETITDWQKILTELHELVEIGLAININTPVSALEPFINDVDFIQCMGIKRIGFQGEPFDEGVIEKIQEIKKKWPEMIVSVDGGVSLEAAPKLVSAGATRLVAGSAIFESGDVEAAIQSFIAL